MRCRASSSARAGGTAVITALLLVPLLALVAFAVDLNYIWSADAQLQTAADAAAQAGATRLLGFAAQAAGPGQTSADLAALRATAASAVADRALAFGQMHQAAGAGLVLNASDVELGFIADPAASPDSTTGQFQTGDSAPFPNSVRVTVRRDGTVSTGPLSLLFGPVLGTPTSSRQASSVATLRGQNVTGFKGSGCRLLPLAMSLTSFQYLTGQAAAPAGSLQDNSTVTLRIDGGPAPPGNVSCGADGRKELGIYPDRNDPGNYGLVSLTNGKATSTPTYSNWIRNGPSAADLATFGPNGLQATAACPAVAYGGPGMKSSLEDDLRSVLGQQRAIIITGPPSGSGSNTTYPILGFVGATIVDVNLGGNGLVVQLSPLIDPTATLGGGPDSGYTQLVYRGISLTR